MIWPNKFLYSWMWLEKELLTGEENVNTEMAFMVEYNVFISLFEKSVISNSNPGIFKIYSPTLPYTAAHKFSGSADTTISVSNVSQQQFPVPWHRNHVFILKITL